MPKDTMLLEHGTELSRLKPQNIIQAAKADLRLKERKKKKTAKSDAMYSFASKHVRAALNPGHLIALAYFNPEPAATTDKKSTFIVYRDRDLLREALLSCLEAE